MTTQDSLFLRKKKIYALMRDLKELCPPQTNKRFSDHLNSLLAKDNDVLDLDDLNASWAKEDFPINKGGEITKELEILWRKLTLEIHELSLLEARSMFNPYVVLFEKVFSCFRQLSQRDDVLFLEELNRKVSLLFEDELVTVEEIYFRLAARFQWMSFKTPP